MLYGVLFVFFLFFFFKQKTAYEMRISDWSSDVCSSDLRGWIEPIFSTLLWARTMLKWALPASNAALAALPAANWRRVRSEERRVGKECVIRVDLGGRRIIKKKKDLQDRTTRSKNE